MVCVRVGRITLWVIKRFDSFSEIGQLLAVSQVMGTSMPLPCGSRWQ